jgi:hypothetical protein
MKDNLIPNLLLNMFVTFFVTSITFYHFQKDEFAEKIDAIESNFRIYEQKKIEDDKREMWTKIQVLKNRYIAHLQILHRDNIITEKEFWELRMKVEE